MITVRSIHEAWELVEQLKHWDLELDLESSAHAGYNVYRNKENADQWVSDLETRLEINDGPKTENIWIEDKVTEDIESHIFKLTFKSKDRYTTVLRVVKQRKSDKPYSIFKLAQQAAEQAKAVMHFNDLGDLYDYRYLGIENNVVDLI